LYQAVGLSEGRLLRIVVMGNTILRSGPFCSRCSIELTTADQTETEGAEESGFSKRALCSDGTRIGVINEEGICKVCGKAYTPDA